jgi:hypothetical protein
MKSIYLKTLVRFALCFLLFLGCYNISNCQQNRMLKVQRLYDSIRSYCIDKPETVLASVIFETGWLECTDCSLGMNNLFGFRLDGGYIGFASYSECLAYMKKWQETFYGPWKAKHQDLSYYDFLMYVNYAQNMPDYIKNIKSLEQWVLQNVEPDDRLLSKLEHYSLLTAWAPYR